jgi:hypothetical protein
MAITEYIRNLGRTTLHTIFENTVLGVNHNPANVEKIMSS